jgi:hypothetical protein
MDLGDAIELILGLFEVICLVIRVTCRVAGWVLGLFIKPRDGAYLTIEKNASRPVERQGFRSITYSRRKPRSTRYVVR